MPPARPAPTVPAGTGSGAYAKRAARTADRIIEDVINLGWPVGTVLGSEVELLGRYDVSRAVFREAVRLLEHREVARTRRGPGGGLVVTEPSVAAVIDSVVLYLHRLDARLDEVFEARIVVEEIACDLAARRLEEEDIIRLRRYLDEEHPPDAAEDPRALHRFLAACSRNAAIELFVDVLNRVALMYSPDWRLYGKEVETAHAHARIAAAVLEGDATTARRRMRIHLQAEGDYLRRKKSTRQILPGSVIGQYPASGKLGESVARGIARSIVTGEMRAGDYVGSEADLMEQNGVSRAVFREAVRLLEYHHIARMRRGPRGGLFVMAPSPEAVTDMAAIYLARRGMPLAKLSELRTAIEVSIVGLAAARAGAPGRAGIEEAIEREASAGDDDPEDPGAPGQVAFDLHTAVARAAGNRVLELVASVLIRLSQLHRIDRMAPAQADRVRAEILGSHIAIAAAVSDGDAELARHRMQRHLDVLGSYLS
ncbi:MAG TPA: FCD domain-containing protein [Acidimicrobiales bacterium]|nr:FCD domain-containing protein [Acidimicrobiales bacterium]